MKLFHVCGLLVAAMFLWQAPASATSVYVVDSQVLTATAAAWVGLDQWGRPGPEFKEAYRNYSGPLTSPVDLFVQVNGVIHGPWWNDVYTMAGAETYAWSFGASVRSYTTPLGEPSVAARANAAVATRFVVGPKDISASFTAGRGTYYFPNRLYDVTTSTVVSNYSWSGFLLAGHTYDFNINVDAYWGDNLGEYGMADEGRLTFGAELATVPEPVTLFSLAGMVLGLGGLVRSRARGLAKGPRKRG